MSADLDTLLVQAPRPAKATEAIKLGTMAEPSPAYASVQALRFLAALMVVLCHVTFYVRERLAPESYFYNLGANGVALFFVISGFVMIVATQPTTSRTRGAESREAGNLAHDWQGFARKRLIRIVPMYWLATTVKLCALLAGAGLVLHARFDVLYIVKSYLFVPAVNADGRIEPLLGVGWTLMFEMLFYGIFCLALGLKRDPFVVCGVAFVTLWVLSLFKTPNWPAIAIFASPLGLEFLWGMAIAKLVRMGFFLPRALNLLGLVIGATLLFVPRLGPFAYLPEGDLVFGLSAALVVLGFVNLEVTQVLRVPGMLVWLGAASYSLYLFHPLIAPAVPALMHRLGLDAPGIAILVSATVAVAAGSLIYALIERPILATLRARLSRGQNLKRASDHNFAAARSVPVSVAKPGQSAEPRQDLKPGSETGGGNRPRRRVAIDAHVLCGKPQGSATALRNTLLSLAQMPLSFDVIVYGEDIEALKAQIGPSDFDYQALPRSGSLKRLLVDLPKRLVADRIDLGVFQFIAPPLCATPSVIVMHDLLPFTHPKLFPIGFRLSRQALFAQALRRASAIVTISDFTAAEILRLFPNQTVRPVVAYNGPSFSPRGSDAGPLKTKALGAVTSNPETSERSSIGLAPTSASEPTLLPFTGPFVLCVGRIEKRKNVDLLVEAFQAARLEGVTLVIVGSQDMGFAWRPPTDRAIVHLSGVPQETLRDLYARASLFVFPSVAEGFGIPLLDALMCGVPAISSDQTAMPEVASGLAQLFDPTANDAVEVLSQAIQSHFRSKPIARTSPSDRARLAKRFSWANSAGTLAQTIDQALARL